MTDSYSELPTYSEIWSEMTEGVHVYECPCGGKFIGSPDNCGGCGGDLYR